jgi:6-pyruvoyltetrahydropterin 2'-reductase
MTEISVAEDFFSIQGEGPHAGTPAVFLRLAGCNLVCGGRENLTRDPDDMEPEGDATWTCDTIDIWRQAERRSKPGALLDDWEARGFAKALSRGAHLVLTGGEPMMEKNQEAIAALSGAMEGRGYTDPFIEVETNGTIEPRKGMWKLVDQWNVSMKLSNSGMEREERINPDAIDFFKYVHDNDAKNDATFKFVLSSWGDAHEVEEIVDRFGIPETMIMAMPAGQTQDQLRESYELVADICKENNWDFSPRLQVDCWGEVTGV